MSSSSNTTRHVMTVDLKDDPPGIAAYRRYHRQIWPEVRDSLLRVGVLRMDIYALGRRLLMVMDTREGFDPRHSFAAHVASHPRCAEWEALMKSFQQAPPGARAGQLWTPMENVFHLERRATNPRGKPRRTGRPRRGR